MQASWNGLPDRPPVTTSSKVDGNALLPRPSSLNSSHCFAPQSPHGLRLEGELKPTITTWVWSGDQVNANAAWFYPEPKAAAAENQASCGFLEGRSGGVEAAVSVDCFQSLAD